MKLSSPQRIVLQQIRDGEPIGNHLRGHHQVMVSLYRHRLIKVRFGLESVKEISLTVIGQRALRTGEFVPTKG